MLHENGKTPKKKKSKPESMQLSQVTNDSGGRYHRTQLGLKFFYVNLSNPFQTSLWVLSFLSASCTLLSSNGPTDCLDGFLLLLPA